MNHIETPQGSQRGSKPPSRGAGISKSIVISPRDIEPNFSPTSHDRATMFSPSPRL